MCWIFYSFWSQISDLIKGPFSGGEGSDSEIETPVRIFENDDGCDDNDMIDGIEADLEIETGSNTFDYVATCKQEQSNWLLPNEVIMI